MIRTSLFLPEVLHQRLILAAKREGMNVSELARELLDRALAKREKAKTKHTYQVLKELDGIGGEDVTDASTTIDKILYGEEGAWKGSNADDTGAHRQ